MRDPATNRYREMVDPGTTDTQATVIYNYPSLSIRSTIPRDWTYLTYKGSPTYQSNQTWDCDNAGYYAARRRGEVVNNDYKNIKIKFSQNVFTPVFTKYIYDGNGVPIGDYRSYYNKWPSEQINSGQLIPATPSGINIDYMIDKAVTSLHAKLSAAPMQALVTLGELNQTIRLAGSLLSKATQMSRFFKKSVTSRAFRQKSRESVIRTLERGPKVNANAMANRLSRQWLEYRYGIRQIYYDYSAAAKALRSLDAKPRIRYTAIEEETEKVENSSPSPVWTGMATHTAHTFASHHCYVIAGALVQPRYSELGFIHAFGLDEVMQSAWELTRFSFVVDWFINVGEKIAALAPKGDIDILTSWVKVISTVTKSGYCTFTPTAASGTTVYECKEWNPRCDYQSVTTIRLKNPVINPIPNWDIRLNVGKITDLLAILKTLPVLR